MCWIISRDVLGYKGDGFRDKKAVWVLIILYNVISKCKMLQTNGKML